MTDGIDLRGFADKLAAQLAGKGRVIVIDSPTLDAALGEPGAANGGQRRRAEPAHLDAPGQRRVRA